MMTVDDVIRFEADNVMRHVKDSPTQFWHRADAMALVREIERLRREPAQTPALTFWLGADACAP